MLGLGTHSGLFDKVCQHDDATGVLFPHHLPEVIGGGWEGALGSYVSVLLLEPLKNKRELLISPRKQGKHVLTSM